MTIAARPTALRTAVIGAGIAGLSCARQLSAAGLTVTIFDKGRGLGGRLATRRVGDTLAFDHGAQYITARSPAFKDFLESARQAGTADRWLPRPGAGTDPSGGEAGGEGGAEGGRDWIVGMPAMNALVKPMADGIELRLKTQVSAVERDGTAWRLRSLDDRDGQVFDRVVCTVPSVQATALVDSDPALVSALEQVVIAPCWALMLGFAAPVDPGFDVMRASDEEDLAWIARNSSKPGRATAKDCWVVHAGPQWSRRHLEETAEAVAEKLNSKLVAQFGSVFTGPEHRVAHRWRYAQTTKPLGRPFLNDRTRSLFVGGDWCLGARVEYGFASGQAIAKALIDGLDHPDQVSETRR